MREVSSAVRQKYTEERAKLQDHLAKKLKEGMATLVGNISHADLNLVASDGQKIPAHSSIIKARAPGFYKKYIGSTVPSRSSSPLKSQSPSTTPKSRTNSKSPSPRPKPPASGTCSLVKLPDVDFNSLRFFLRNIYTEEEVAANPGALRMKDNKDNDGEGDRDDSGSNSDRSGGRKENIKRGNDKGANQKTYTIDASPNKKTRRNEKGSVEEDIDQSMYTSTGSELDNETQMSTSSEQAEVDESRQSPLKFIQPDTPVSDLESMQTSLQDTDIEECLSAPQPTAICTSLEDTEEDVCHSAPKILLKQSNMQNVEDSSSSAPQAMMTSFKQIAMESPKKELKVPPLSFSSDEPHIFDDVKNDRLIITQTVTETKSLPLSSSYPKLPPAILSPEMSPTSKDEKTGLHQTYRRNDFGGDMTSSLIEQTPMKEDQMIAKFIHFNDLGSPSENLERDGVAFVPNTPEPKKPMFPIFVEFNKDNPAIFPRFRAESSENITDEFNFTPLFSRKRQPSVTSLRSLDSADFSLSPMQEQYRGLGQIEPFPPQDISACSLLGEDLLQMYMSEQGADVTLQTNSGDISAHKCVLSATCSYFHTMLMDASINTIKLRSKSHACVDFCMQFLYGGVTCLPDDVSVWELVALAKELVLEDLLSVAKLHIRGKCCHFFHKPCGTCVASTMDILGALGSNGLDDLLNECLQWQAKHFCRIWKTRAFAQLPDSTHNQCYSSVISGLSPATVLDVILSCEKLQATLPRNARVGAAESVASLVACLMDSAIEFTAANLDHVIISEPFLNQGKGLGLNVGLLEDLIPGVVHSLAPDTACRVLVRLYELLVFLSAQDLNRSIGGSQSHSENEWNKRFTNLIRRLYEICDNHLIHHAAAVVKCDSWSLLTPSMQSNIKETGIFVELRQPRAPPPKLSSLNRTYKRSSSSGSRYIPSPSRDRSQSIQRKTSATIVSNDPLMEEAENIASPRTAPPAPLKGNKSVASSAVLTPLPSTNEVLDEITVDISVSEQVVPVTSKRKTQSATPTSTRPSTVETTTKPRRAESFATPTTATTKLPQPNPKEKLKGDVPSRTTEPSKVRQSRDSKSNGTFIKSPKHKPPAVKLSNSSTFENLDQTVKEQKDPVSKRKVVKQLTHEIESPSHDVQDQSPRKKMPESEPVVVASPAPVSKPGKPLPMATVKPTISGQTIDRKSEDTIAQANSTKTITTASVRSDKTTVSRPSTINVQKQNTRKSTVETKSTKSRTSSNTIKK